MKQFNRTKLFEVKDNIIHKLKELKSQAKRIKELEMENEL